MYLQDRSDNLTFLHLQDLETNVSLSCLDDYFSRSQFIFFVCTLSLVVLSFNVVVILTICRTPALHTNTDIIVASLSTGDAIFCFAFVIQSMRIFVNVSLNEHQHNLLSSLLLGLTYGPLITSLTHLGAVAVDRYIFIAHPFYYIQKMTKQCTLKVLLVVWVTGFAYTVLPLLIYTDKKFHIRCILLNPPSSYAYTIVVTYVTNVIIIFTCYLKIARLAFQHKKAVIARRIQYRAAGPSHTASAQNRMAAMRSVQFFALMFGVFVTCTLLPVTFVAVNNFQTVTPMLHTSGWILFVVNCLANCLIYGSTRKGFLKALMTFCLMMKCRCGRREEY